jgi:hypothetical protein
MQNFVSDYQYYKVAKYNQIGCSHFRGNRNFVFRSSREGPRMLISAGHRLVMGKLLNDQYEYCSA